MPIDLIMIKNTIRGRARSLKVGTMSLLWQRRLLFDEPFSMSSISRDGMAQCPSIICALAFFCSIVDVASLRCHSQSFSVFIVEHGLPINTGT